MVLRLKGGGDFRPAGPVGAPAVVEVVPVVPVLVPFGDTSGEKRPPRAYSERLSPYVLARLRFTSRISTSTTISARGLSFCAMILSRIPTTGAVPRTVMELDVLLPAMAGCTAIPGRRMMVLRICVISVASALDK